MEAALRGASRWRGGLPGPGVRNGALLSIPKLFMLGIDELVRGP